VRSRQAQQLLAKLQGGVPAATLRGRVRYRRAICFEGLALEVASNHRSIIAQLGSRYAFENRRCEIGGPRVALIREHNCYLLTSSQAMLLLRQGRHRLYFAYRSGELHSLWAGSWTGHPDPCDRDAMSPGVLRLLDREIVAEYIRRLPRLLFLHAAAVSLANGTTCLLVGAAGSGKTTLARALAAQGGRVVTDDICPVGADLRPRPFPRRSPLRQGSKSLLASLGDEAEAPAAAVKPRPITSIIVLEGFSRHGEAREGTFDECLRAIAGTVVGLPRRPMAASRVITKLVAGARVLHLRPARRRLETTLRVIDASIASTLREEALGC